MNLAFIDPDGFPGVENYFEQEPRETVKPALSSVARFDVTHFLLDRKLSLQGLAGGILANCDAGDSVVVVSHGTPDSLLIPVGAGSKKILNVKHVRLVQEALASRIDHALAATELGFPGKKGREDFNLLVKNMRLVQKANLNHVAFRACRAGRNLELVIALANLFNCRTISIPKLRDFFVKSEVKFISSADMDKTQRERPNIYYYGEKPHRVVMDFKLTKPTSSKGIFWVGAETTEDVRKAKTSEAIERFMAAKFSHGNAKAFKRGGHVYLHGLWLEGVAPYFYFPNDPGYNMNLQTWSNEPFVPDMYIPPDSTRRNGLAGLIDDMHERQAQRRMQRAARWGS